MKRPPTHAYQQQRKVISIIIVMMFPDACQSAVFCSISHHFHGMMRGRRAHRCTRQKYKQIARCIDVRAIITNISAASGRRCGHAFQLLAAPMAELSFVRRLAACCYRCTRRLMAINVSASSPAGEEVAPRIKIAAFSRTARSLTAHLRERGHVIGARHRRRLNAGASLPATSWR